MLLSILIFITILLNAVMLIRIERWLKRLEDVMADRERKLSKFEQQVILSLTRIERGVAAILELVKTSPDERMQQLANQLNDKAEELQVAIDENK